MKRKLFLPKVTMALVFLSLLLSVAWAEESKEDLVKLIYEDDRMVIQSGVPSVEDKKDPLNQFLLDRYNSWVKSSTKEFKELVDMDYPKGSEKPEYFSKYDLSISAPKITKFCPRYRTILIGESTYFGGAHPMYGIYTESYDVRKKKRVRLDDIFNPEHNYLAHLSKLLEENLVASLYESEDPDRYTDWIKDGLDPKNKSNFDTFTLYEDGIIFHFQPYQVAPYAAGAPEVKIDWIFLTPYLQGHFYERAKEIEMEMEREDARTEQ